MSIDLKNDNYYKNLRFIYLLTLCLLNIQTYLANSAIPTGIQSHIKIIYTLITIVSLCLLLSKIAFDKHTIPGYVLIGITLFISVIISHYSNEMTIPLIVLLVTGAKNINFTDIMKVFFKTDFTLTILLIISSLMHIIPDVTSGGHSGSFGLRHSLGFGGPTKLSESILVLCVVYSIIHYSNIKWIRIFILIILAYFVLIIPNTRMDYYGLIFLIIITIIKKLSPSWLHNFPFNIAWLSLPVMTLINFYIAIFYNNLITNQSFVNFDKSLEYRLFDSSYWLTSSKISLFGTNLTKSTQIVLQNGFIMHNYIDQSMIRIFIMYGIIAFMTFIIIYTCQMYKLNKEGLNFFVLLFMIIVFKGFFDVNMIQIIGNPFLLIIFANLGNIKQFMESSKNKRIIYN